jgi:hypothetical protein
MITHEKRKQEYRIIRLSLRMCMIIVNLYIHMYTYTRTRARTQALINKSLFMYECAWIVECGCGYD